MLSLLTYMWGKQVIKYIHIIEDKFLKYMHIANGEKNLVSPLSEIRNILIQLLEQRLKKVRDLTFPCLNDRS